MAVSKVSIFCGGGNEALFNDVDVEFKETRAEAKIGVGLSAPSTLHIKIPYEARWESAEQIQVDAERYDVLKEHISNLPHAQDDWMVFRVQHVKKSN